MLYEIFFDILKYMHFVSECYHTLMQDSTMCLMTSDILQWRFSKETLIYRLVENYFQITGQTKRLMNNECQQKIKYNNHGCIKKLTEIFWTFLIETYSYMVKK